MKEYDIYGDVVFHVDFTIKAHSEEEAIRLGLDRIEDYYHLNVDGAYHIPSTLSVNIDAVDTEYEGEEEINDEDVSWDDED